MKSHQFELDPHRSIEGNVIRMYAYIRNRFGKGRQPAKGRAVRNAASVKAVKSKGYVTRLTGRAWPRG